MRVLISLTAPVDDLADFTEVQNTVRTRMTQAVNRYEKATNEYLENVVLGKFPLRSSKDKNKTADKYSGF